MQNGTQQLTGELYKPGVVLGDGAMAITLAVRNTFGADCPRAMCWAHVYRKVQKQLMSVSEDTRSSVLKELQLLQVAPDASTFSMAVPLFLQWLDTNPELAPFKAYFTRQWLGELFGWFEGFTGVRASTNNGLEAINGTLKSSYTLRDRLPLPRFLQKALEAAEVWSFTLG